MSDKCRFFPACGGCQLLEDLDDEYKAKKKLLLHDILQSKLALTNDPNWFWTPDRSRRKIVLQINSQNQIGYFASRSRELVEVDSCYISLSEISDLIKPLAKIIKSMPVKVLKQVIITRFDSGINILLKAQKEISFKEQERLLGFAKDYDVNLSVQVNQEILPILILRKNQINYPKFKIDLEPDIFIQANKIGSENILKIIRSSLNGHKNIADLYSGYGAYSFGIIDLATKISSFEYSEKMVNLIKKNSKNLGFIDKLSANHRDLELNPLTSKELKLFNAVIINPPRAGAINQIKEIGKSNIKKIIYVSCSPKSFARDAKILIDSNFHLKNITAIDQFYGSNHIELVAVFNKDL